MRATDETEYREGVVLNKHAKPGKGCFVNIGLDKVRLHRYLIYDNIIMMLRYKNNDQTIVWETKWSPIGAHCINVQLHIKSILSDTLLWVCLSILRWIFSLPILNILVHNRVTLLQFLFTPYFIQQQYKAILKQENRITIFKPTVQGKEQSSAGEKMENKQKNAKLWLKTHALSLCCHKVTMCLLLSGDNVYKQRL